MKLKEIMTPGVEVIHPDTTIQQAAAKMRRLERQQVAAYTTLIREIGDSDPTTRRLLLEILADTERHASELADYLKSTAEVRS